MNFIKLLIKICTVRRLPFRRIWQSDCKCTIQPDGSMLSARFSLVHLKFQWS